MRFIKIIIAILLFNFCYGQTRCEDDIQFDLVIHYKPVVVLLTGEGLHYKSTPISNNQKRIYELKTGYYRVSLIKNEKIEEGKDSIYIDKNQRLILNLKLVGPCLYNYPKNSLPLCPQNHSDNILHIVYGLIPFLDETKFKRGGCVITDCDPQFYCTKHKIEF